MLAAVKSPSRATSKVGFARPLGKDRCVIFGDQLQQHWNLYDAQSLLDELIDDARDAITDGKYSRDAKAKTYRPFEPWEVSFIKEELIP